MDDSAYAVEGEIIKLIHDELPAVRWMCGNCNEDSCTIFYDATESEKAVECEYCGANNQVRKPDAA